MWVGKVTFFFKGGGRGRFWGFDWGETGSMIGGGGGGSDTKEKISRFQMCQRLPLNNCMYMCITLLCFS